MSDNFNIGEMFAAICKPMPANLMEYPMYFAFVIGRALREARDHAEPDIIRDVGPSISKQDGTRVMHATDFNGLKYEITIRVMR